MRNGFNLALLFVGGALALLSGCEARNCDNTKKVEYEADSEMSKSEDGACVELVSLKKWWGDTEQFTGDYTSGKNVLVDSGNGNIVVRRTNRDDIRATFKPFVSRAHDTCDGAEPTTGDRCAEIDDNLSDQELIFEEDNGNYLIQAKRMDAVASLGAEIEVELPNSFDGRLTVDQGNGSTDIEDMGDAAAVIVGSDNGTCDINTGAAPYIDIRCENGSTDVTIGEVVPGDDDLRQIYKEDGDLGDLTIRFPSTDEPFNVQAQSENPVDISPANPSGCDVAGKDPRSVTVSCNDGTNQDPVYTITNAESLGDVYLVF